LQPRSRLLVWHGVRVCGPAATHSLRPSAGGADEKPKARARDVVWRADPVVSWTTVPGSPDQRPLSAGRVSARKLQPPRAFHGIDGSIMGPTGLPDTITEGHARAFRPSHTRAPFLLRRTIDDLVQVSGLLRRSTSSPRWASRLASNPSPRCLEHRFYNRRFASRAPAETPSSETLRRRTVGKPAGLRLRGSPSIAGVAARSSATPDHLAVIRPPTASRLTARCRLRETRRFRP
jgi:hypothetical protein